MVKIDIRGEINQKSHDKFMEDLSLLMPQIREQKAVQVRISSHGGNVKEGFDIALALHSLAEEGIEVTTLALAECNSIAIIIFLAGQNRIISRQNVSFVVHEVQGGIEGSTSEIADYAVYLKQIQDTILDTYEVVTGRSKTELEPVMKAGKSLNIDQILSYNFATQIQNMDIKQKLANIFNKFKPQPKKPANIYMTVLMDKTVITVDSDSPKPSDWIGKPIMVGEGPAPDGTYETWDGIKITVKGNVVESVEGTTNMEETKPEEEPGNNLVELQALIMELVGKLEGVVTNTEKMQAEVKDLQSNDVKIVDILGAVSSKVAPINSYEEAPQNKSEVEVDYEKAKTLLNKKRNNDDNSKK